MPEDYSNVFDLFSERAGEAMRRRREAGQAVVQAAGQRPATQWERETERFHRELENERWAEGHRPSFFKPWSALWFAEMLVKVVLKAVRYVPSIFFWSIAVLVVGVPALLAIAVGGVAIALLIVSAVEYWDFRSNGATNALVHVSPVGDFHRLWQQRVDRKARERAEDLVVAMGIISADELEVCDAYLDDWGEHPILRICLPFPGFSLEKVTELVEAGLVATRVYVDADVVEKPGAWFEITLRTEMKHDYTQDVHKIDAPLELVDVDKLTIPVGVNPAGETQTISLAGNSGLVMAGLPGKGKTAGAVTLLTPLLLSEYADVHLIDGKGGMDWGWAESAAKFFTNDDVNLQAVLDHLKSMQEMMRERVKTQKELFGDSNFWNQKRDPSHRAQVIVIDEAQAFFETAARPKDEKAIIDQIQASTRDLIKKGRSAGFLTVLITQKPTSDAIPTSIRDVCGLRVSFYVSTPEMATAVLGAVPEGAPSPTQINPRNVGCSVMATESGEFEQVKWFYLPEAAAEAAVQAAAASRTGSEPEVLDEASAELDEP